MTDLENRPPTAFGDRLNLPFSTGLMLAANAIDDVALLVDGPGCIMAKARQIHARHDLCSTVLSCVGDHRILDSRIDVFRIATTYEPLLTEGLDELALRSGIGMVMLSSLPLDTIAGTDYERIAREASSRCSIPIIWVPERSLAGDWLTGYSAALLGLAKDMDLSDASPRPGSVAVVGYLMDRLEGDHRGNIAELGSLLNGLGLDMVSLWPSGGNLDSLRAVRHASAVISLPHGREAARTLAERLSIPLIETDLPFGLDGTRRWLETLGEALGCQPQADELCDQQFGSVIPRLEWVVPQVFLGRRFVYVGDPHYGTSLTHLLEELGATIPELFLVGQKESLPEELAVSLSAGRQIWFEPSQELLLRRWKELSKDAGLDLLITSGLGYDRLQPTVSWMEWGFPSPCTHFLRDQPFLGFHGALAFLERCMHVLGRPLT